MPTLKLLSRGPHNPYDLKIRLKFFGESFVCLIDTGANKTCISQRLFNHIAAHSCLEETIYRSISERQYHGVGGVEKSQKIPIKIRFLGKIIESVTIGHFLDEWRKINLTCDAHDILLGQDVMGQFKRVVIDNEKGEISFL